MSETAGGETSPASYFTAMTDAFSRVLAERRFDPAVVGGLCALAFDSFERTAAAQAEGAAPLACKGECAACCGLRVVVTAPEAFLLARFVTANREALLSRGVDAMRWIDDADAATRGLSQSGRMALDRACALLHEGLCIAYRLRPLACRGHASYDRAACEAAARGEDVETAVSGPHVVVRGIIQNALMHSLRKAGLRFGLYELHGGVADCVGAAAGAVGLAGRGGPIVGGDGGRVRRGRSGAPVRFRHVGWLTSRTHASRFAKHAPLPGRFQ